MIKLKRIDEFDYKGMPSIEACRILQSRRKYLLKVEDNIHLVDNYISYITKNYPDLPIDIPEVYVLNHL